MRVQYSWISLGLGEVQVPFSLNFFFNQSVVHLLRINTDSGSIETVLQ